MSEKKRTRAWVARKLHGKRITREVPTRVSITEARPEPPEMDRETLDRFEAVLRTLDSKG